MDYREYPPSVELRSFVRCFWTLRGSGAAVAEPVVLDGSFEIIIHLGDPFLQSREGAESVQPQSLLVAHLCGPVTITPSSSVDVLAVRFRPGCAWPFMNQPLDKLEGELHALDDVWPARRLREVIGNACDDVERIQVLESELTRLLRDSYRPDGFQ